MKKIVIEVSIVPDAAFTEPGATDFDLAAAIRKIAEIAGVGDPSVERPGTKRLVVRDGLGNACGSARIE